MRTIPSNDVITSVVRVHMLLRQERQQDLAAVLGVSAAQVSRRLTGQARWSADDLDAMAEHYRVTPAAFLTPITSELGQLVGLPAPREQSATGSWRTSALIGRVPVPRSADAHETYQAAA